MSVERSLGRSRSFSSGPRRRSPAAAGRPALDDLLETGEGAATMNRTFVVSI